MNSDDVIDLYNQLSDRNIAIWVDGGWCVDALVGEQTRKHPDLDIAVDRKNASQLKETLISLGYKDEPRNDTTEWNYAMASDKGSLIDVHVFEFDDTGKNIYGIEYPKKSLTGTDRIDGQEVNCISPEWMFKFKTTYEPKQKDLQDVNALAKKYGFSVPSSHQQQKN